MEPPIQTEYLRSGGATTLTFIELGARAVISLFMRSAMPGNIVVPAQRREGGRVASAGPSRRAARVNGEVVGRAQGAAATSLDGRHQDGDTRRSEGTVCDPEKRLLQWKGYGESMARGQDGTPNPHGIKQALRRQGAGRQAVNRCPTHAWCCTGQTAMPQDR